jgi:protocatechuate 3,4-dioxygenase, alpha subunit
VPGITPWQTLGPFFDRKLVGERAWDLTRDAPAAAPPIEIAGRVVQGDGRAVAGCLIELWQADAAGRYAQPAERSGRAPATGFSGFGRTLTDGEGRFAFRTVKPGPVPYRGNQWQAPHILVSLFAAGLLRRLVTRLYFADEPATADDPALAAIHDRAARQSLQAELQDAGPPPRYRFDIVLQGEGETAFFTD